MVVNKAKKDEWKRKSAMKKVDKKKSEGKSRNQIVSELVREQAIIGNVDRLMGQGHTRGQASERVARNIAIGKRLPIEEARKLVKGLAEGDLSAADRPMPLGPITRGEGGYSRRMGYDPSMLGGSTGTTTPNRSPINEAAKVQSAEKINAAWGTAKRRAMQTSPSSLGPRVPQVLTPGVVTQRQPVEGNPYTWNGMMTQH